MRQRVGRERQIKGRRAKGGKNRTKARATAPPSSADLQEQVNILTQELKEAHERQTATAEVLQVINLSPGELAPVFQTILEKAHSLCRVSYGSLILYDGDKFRAVAVHGIAEAFADRLRQGFVPGRNHPTQLLLKGGRFAQVPDCAEIDDPIVRAAFELGGIRTVLFIPLRRKGSLLGQIAAARQEVNPFNDKEIALLQTFADQAVIAIENAGLFKEVQAKTRALEESLEHQTATSEVLNVISRSPVDAGPVFKAIVESAARLCNGVFANVRLYDGHQLRVAATHNFTPEVLNRFLRRHPTIPDRSDLAGRCILERRVIHVADVLVDPEYGHDMALAGGWRAVVSVPMLRDGTPVGIIAVSRAEPKPFLDREIELLVTFADQAVIAIRNVGLFEEVQAKTRDLEESLQQQTATADVLKVISRSAFDLQTVLDTLTESAARLCNADLAAIARKDDGGFYHATNYNFPVDWVRVADVYRIQPGRGSLIGRVLLAKKAVQIDDVLADPEYAYPDMQQVAGYRTLLGVPLMRSTEPIGVLFLGRKVVLPFTEKQIELVSTFADQAVIAIENARLFDEVQVRTRELSEALTYQTGSANILRVIASSPTDVAPVLKSIVESACELCEAYDAVVMLRDGDQLSLGAHHGPIPTSQQRWSNDRTSISGRAIADRVPVHVHDVLSDEGADFAIAREMSRVDGCRTLLSAPLLREGESIGAIVLRRAEAHPFSEKQIALLQTFADQAVIAIGNVRLFEEVQARTRELTKSLEDLRSAQDRLIQTEKLASLGQLTAGIAHEIKNPLNFVNNFSALSAELVDELNGVLEDASFDEKKRKELDEIRELLKSNLEKVVQHGKRADSIVKNMLLHSRSGSSEHGAVEINGLIEESLNLAYHGARAEGRNFNITLERDFDPLVGSADIYAQEITRVLLNLISNGFYAATKRAAVDGNGFEPKLKAVTRNLGDKVEIRIRDNGSGIPPAIREKIFNPFFTTKPAGEGTGLGLSMSYDIVVKQHGGTIDVVTEPGSFTEFIIRLPRIMPVQAEAGGRESENLYSCGRRRTRPRAPVSPAIPPRHPL